MERQRDYEASLASATNSDLILISNDVKSVQMTLSASNGEIKIKHQDYHEYRGGI